MSVLNAAVTSKWLRPEQPQCTCLQKTGVIYSLLVYIKAHFMSFSLFAWPFSTRVNALDHVAPLPPHLHQSWRWIQIHLRSDPVSKPPWSLFPCVSRELGQPHSQTGVILPQTPCICFLYNQTCLCRKHSVCPNVIFIRCQVCSRAAQLCPPDTATATFLGPLPKPHPFSPSGFLACIFYLQ